MSDAVELALRQAIQRVRDYHRPVRIETDAWLGCAGCIDSGVRPGDTKWPCATLRALDDAPPIGGSVTEPLPPNAPGWGSWLTEEHLRGDHENGNGSSACGLCGWRPEASA